VYRIRTIQTAAELDAIRPLWDELARDGTIFQSFAWNRAAAACFSRTEQPHVICCESSTGAAIVPAVIRQDGSLSLLGEKLFDYRDVLYDGDQGALARTWQELCGLHRPFALTALRDEQSCPYWRKAGLQLYAFAPCTRLQDLCTEKTGTESSSALKRGLPVSASAARETFLRLHSRLAGHARRIAKQGIMLRRHQGRERELVRFIYDSKGRQKTANENLFGEHARREFMMQVVNAPASGCEVFTYETESELVAALVTFRDGATRHFYTIYYDARWAEWSPGQLLLFETAAQSLGEGLNCDYMTGEYLYKNRIATSRVPLFTVNIPAERMPRVFESFDSPLLRRA